MDFHLLLKIWAIAKTWAVIYLILDHAKESTTDALKTTWKRVIQKIVEAMGWFNWQYNYW